METSNGTMISVNMEATAPVVQELVTTTTTEPHRRNRHRNIIRRKTEKLSALNTLLAIASILSLNCFGSVVIVALFITYFNINEMRIIGSYEIVYTVFVLIAATIIKIAQCALCFKMRNVNFSLFVINHLLYFPVILLLWPGLNSTSFQYSLKTLPESKGNDIQEHFLNRHIQNPIIHSNEYAMYPLMYFARNAVQKKHLCCGMHSYNEYIKNGVVIPRSCCMYSMYLITNENCIPYQRGCLVVIQRHLSDINSQLHNILLMFLLPIEIIASFALLVTYLIQALRKYKMTNNNANTASPNLAQSASHSAINVEENPSNLRITNTRDQTIFDPPPSYQNVVTRSTDV